MLEAFMGKMPPEIVDTKMACDPAGQGALENRALSSDNSQIFEIEVGEVRNQALTSAAFVFDPDWLTHVAAQFDAGFSLSELGTSLSAEVQFDAPSAEGGQIGIADTVPIWGPDADGFGFI